MGVQVARVPPDGFLEMREWRAFIEKGPVVFARDQSWKANGGCPCCLGHDTRAQVQGGALLLQPLKYMLRLNHINRSWWIRSFYLRNEDRFWSDQARLIYPDFKVCSVESGLQFGFDEEPAYCFEQNGRKLPFGCHGWYKYDRQFWEPYLLKDGLQQRAAQKSS